jgi:hypothetical protein
MSANTHRTREALGHVGVNGKVHLPDCRYVDRRGGSMPLRNLVEHWNHRCQPAQCCFPLGMRDLLRYVQRCALGTFTSQAREQWPALAADLREIERELAP